MQPVYIKNAVLAATIAAPVFAYANETVLYRSNDYNYGTDYLGQALKASGDTVTSMTGSIVGYNLNNYNVVVYANQNSPIPGNDLAQLNTYVQAGGHVIFDDWNVSSLAGVSATGKYNFDKLIVGTQFSSGLINPLSVVDPGWRWGIYSYGLNAGVGNVVAGRFSNGDAAIVVADSGHVIYDGFLSDTVASTTLYANELNSLGVSTVPEPANCLLVITGLAALGFTHRRIH